MKKNLVWIGILMVILMAACASPTSPASPVDKNLSIGGQSVSFSGELPTIGDEFNLISDGDRNYVSTYTYDGSALIHQSNKMAVGPMYNLVSSKLTKIWNISWAWDLDKEGCTPSNKDLLYEGTCARGHYEYEFFD
jgi:hypothetical protein